MSLVEVEQLGKRYAPDVVALDAVSFTVEAGEWIAVTGPSGSGKTTLVNLLGALDRPTSGRVRVAGTDLAALSAEEQNRFRAERVGFVFQQFHLVPYLSSLENVLLAQYFHSLTDEAQAQAALERVGLGHRLHHRPAELSAGEQQRVCIARALINQPKLILADEPTGNLDERNEAIVMQLFHQLHRQGHTLILVTHDLGLARLADRRIELQHGRVVEISTPQREEEEHFDHLLEQIWVLAEDHQAADTRRLELAGVLDVVALLGRMAERGLVRLADGAVRLTPAGQERAGGVMRRHRLAERLFFDTFDLDDREAESTACQFEHILSPQVTDKICAFLGHPATCPHGKPIPAGACCPRR
ncbi:MAG: ATP-binding cassette domain-containing protein [Acidobacteria bacterium]|nr:ATP-binding cassette domain-containing protein [Acidobacteriota bacterium]